MSWWAMMLTHLGLYGAYAGERVIESRAVQPAYVDEHIYERRAA